MTQAATSSTVTTTSDSRHVIREGLAAVAAPEQATTESGTISSVFYNPVQQYNRDLTVVAIRAFAEDYTWCKSRAKKTEDRWSRGKKRKRGQDKGDEEKAQTDGRAPATAGQPAVEPSRPNGIPTSFRILDALSATGLRALRYAKEIPAATHITANDLAPSACEAIRANVSLNKVEDRVHVSTGDAKEVMNGIGEPFTVIDLDPYGTAVPFLDAAVRGVADGGLLCVTCTDAGVFASTSYTEKTFSQYGGLPIKGPHAHEGGLRLVLQSIATAASRYGVAMEPLLSLSIDFYIRVFVRLHKSPAAVKFTASKTMLVHSCDVGCGAWTTQYLGQARARESKIGETFYKYTPALGPSASETCEQCGTKTHLAGPMWAGPLHNPHFIARILDMLPELNLKVYPTIPRMEGMLTIALHEDLEDLSSPRNPPSNKSSTPQANDRPVPVTDPAIRSAHPFFISPPHLASVLRIETPPEALVHSALVGLGYRTARSHTKASSIRTDAPWSVVWDVMRAWLRRHVSDTGVKEFKAGTAGYGIMQRGKEGSKMDSVRAELEAALHADNGEHSLRKRVEDILSKLGTTKGISDGAETDVPASRQIIFDEAKGKQAIARLEGRKKIVRYQQNPLPNWGPKGRALMGIKDAGSN